MLKYLVFILVVMFSQIKGGEIIHTETRKDGSISSITYFKKFKVEGRSIIYPIKKEEYSYFNIMYKETIYSKRIPYGEMVSENQRYGGKGERKEYEIKYTNLGDTITEEWYENGQKKSKSTVTKEFNMFIISWYENGQKKKEFTSKGEEIISNKEWNEDGSVKE